MRGAALAVAGLAVVAGIVLGLEVLPATSSAVTTPTAAAPTGLGAGIPTTTPAPEGCPDAAALLTAYVAGQGGDSRSVLVPGSVRCAGPYVAADVRDPSLPDQLNVLFSVSPIRKLRSGTGPVCEVGSGEGGLPPVSAAQGDVLNCA